MTPIWQPDPEQAGRSTIALFGREIDRAHDLDLPEYDALWRWSTEHVADFWLAAWNYFGVRSDPAPTQVLTSTEMPSAVWFPGVRLNYVDHVFRDRDADAIAIVAVLEGDRRRVHRRRCGRRRPVTAQNGRYGYLGAGLTDPGDSVELSWGELEGQVAALAATLRELGVSTGDRVVGYLPNTVAPLVGFLATAVLGAIWSCCAPDYAAPAAANRLAQLEPTVLICADGSWYGGRPNDRRDEAVRLAELPSLRAVVHVRHLGLEPLDFSVPVVDWSDAAAAIQQQLAPLPVPFDHPLWVLYSSGTTVVPKGLVPRPRRRRARQLQGLRAAPRPRPRRPEVLVHHHELDDVELQRIGPARRRVDRRLRRRPSRDRTGSGSWLPTTG